jgi:hypothetical protein
MKTSKEFVKSPFIHTEPVIPPFFAGRNKEMKYIYRGLFEEKESVIIYGNDAIGKSSIISTVYKNQIEKRVKKIFPVRICAFDFIKSVDSNFFGITVHQICANIWINLMGNKYSDLRSIHSTWKLFKSDEEKTIIKIFKVVTSENYSLSEKTLNELGGKAFIEAKTKISNESINQPKPLAPFEFLYLLDELNDIINKYDYDSILILCDELNHYPTTNIEFLRNYLSIFQSKQIQFFLVVVNPDLYHQKEARDLLDSFNFRIEIEPYKSIDDVKELIDNSINTSKQEISYNTEILEFLYEKTSGHPWFIQKICDSAFTTLSNSSNYFDMKLIEECHKNYSEEISIYNKLIKEGLPFRKRYLNQ